MAASASGIVPASAASLPSPPRRALPAVARFAWGVLAYDVGVVAWGAYVRATGSGAGCGRHWPTCNGEIVPRAPRVATAIEFSHRASSGVALVLTVALFVWTWLAFPRRHAARRSAGAATGFMVAEALIGAGLVLFSLVAKNASLTRALSITLHLVNTFLLLGATSLAALWASGGAPLRLRGRRAVVVAVLVPLAAMLITGAVGAVAALGDTLFPATSLAAGIASDFAPGANVLLRIRVLHPFFAMATAAVAIVSAGFARAVRPVPSVRAASYAAVVLAVVQVAAGVLDVLLRAPVAMQLAHVVLADSLWIALVLTAATTLADA